MGLNTRKGDSAFDTRVIRKDYDIRVDSRLSDFYNRKTNMIPRNFSN